MASWRDVSMASLTPSRAFARALHHMPRRRIPAPQCLYQRRTAATYTSPKQASQFSILQTAVDQNSNGFKENAMAMKEYMDRLDTLHTTAAKGGSEKARQKHVERGKLLVRDRITALIDPGTSFLELSALAGHEMYPGEDVAAGGIVTGIGTVEGVMCMILANDSTYVIRPTPDIPLTDSMKGEGRLLLPNNNQKAHPCTGNRPTEPPTLYIPCGLRRSQSSEPGQCLP